MSTAVSYEQLLGQHEHTILRLYITGMSPRSTQAIAAIRAICEDLLPGQYELEIVDLYEHPARASEEQVIAAPTLVRERPLPVRRLIGNLADTERVLHSLNLRKSG